MGKRICRWLRHAFPRYFYVKDAARIDAKDMRASRAAREQNDAAARLAVALDALQISMAPERKR